MINKYRDCIGKRFFCMFNRDFKGVCVDYECDPSYDEATLWIKRDDTGKVETVNAWIMIEE